MLREMAVTFEKLQIGKVTNEAYTDLLFSSGVIARERYQALVKDQMRKANISLDSIIDGALQAKEIVLLDVLRQVAGIKNSVSITDHSDQLHLIQWENGEPVISSAALREIEEIESVYAESDRGLEAYKLQQKALKALSEYVDFLRTGSTKWKPNVEGNIFETDINTGRVKVIELDLEWAVAQ